MSEILWCVHVHHQNGQSDYIPALDYTRAHKRADDINAYMQQHGLSSKAVPAPWFGTEMEHLMAMVEQERRLHLAEQYARSIGATP